MGAFVVDFFFYCVCLWVGAIRFCFQHSHESGLFLMKVMHPDCWTNLSLAICTAVVNRQEVFQVAFLVNFIYLFLFLFFIFENHQTPTRKDRMTDRMKEFKREMEKEIETDCNRH